MFILWESFRSALTAIRANLLRSVLTSLGIIIGIMSTITVVSLIQGLERSVVSQFEGMGSNSINVWGTWNARVRDAGLSGTITEEDLFRLRRDLGDRAEITPQTFLPSSNLSFGSQSMNVSNMLGVTPDYYQISQLDMAEGRPTVMADGINRSRTVVIGETVRRNLELPTNPIGSFVRLEQEWLKVIGLLEAKGRTMGFDNDNIALVPFETALSISGPLDANMMLVVRARDADQVDEIAEQIKQSLRRSHGITADMPDDFEVMTSSAILEEIASFTAILTLVFGGIVAISLLVGGIGIMNIMLVSVTERTREIGICKALGATRGQILLQFLIEAIVLCLVGGLIGLGLGALIGLVAAPMIPGLDAQAHIPMWAIWLSLGFSTAVGVIFGLLPAAKASRLDPIDALRYE